MKLDKIKFATLIGYLSSLGCVITEATACKIDTIIDIDVPEPEQKPINYVALAELMLCMTNGIDKIEAIKAYRVLTGASLKDSKDAVERFWISRYEKDQIHD